MKNTSHKYNTKRDLDLDMDTNIINIKKYQYDDAYVY